MCVKRVSICTIYASEQRSLMLVDRALMFVHQGMDVEEQWEKAVNALCDMSNLHIALVWRRLSSYAGSRDFRTHSELKCLYKRAVREAEHRMSVIPEIKSVVVDEDREDDISGYASEDYLDFSPDKIGLDGRNPGRDEKYFSMDAHDTEAYKKYRQDAQDRGDDFLTLAGYRNYAKPEILPVDRHDI